MKFKYLLVHLVSLCIGVFIYIYITDQPMIEAVTNSYWCVFGGVSVWFKMRGKVI